MPYQSTPEDRTRAYIIGAIYVVLVILLAIMIFKVWPPIPWPLVATDKDKEALTAYFTDTACSDRAPKANTNQAAGSPSASNTVQPSTQTTTTTGTQPTTTGGGQTGTQTAPTGTTSPAAGAAQPVGQPANQAAGSGPTTTPASGGVQTNTEAGVTSGEIVRIPINLFGKYGPCLQTTYDERLILLVIIAGMLGAFIHGATSLADYLGNDSFNKNWTWFYLLRPAIGMALALVIYFGIRGGLLSTILSTPSSAKDISPYGIAAFAGMVGMFSKQATDKLTEIFGTLFRSAPGNGDDQRADSLNGSTAGTLKLDPPSAVAGGDAFTLNVTGTGFVNGATINVNDTAQPTTFVSATQLSAQIAKETIANAGTLKVTVVNPDQTKTGPVDLVVSGTSDAAATAEKPVDGEGGDEDLIDGCDVDMKADTPDEDLPITEGGVK